MTIDISSIYGQTALIRLDVTIWTGRAKLHLSDLPNGGKDLPPETLASLGSKKLFDPKELQPFNTLKARAYKYLCRVGFKFMGGFGIPVDYLHSVDAELACTKQDFDDAATSFIRNYAAGLNNWVAQFPEWRSIILSAAPDAHELARKFRFAWQGYTLSPLSTGDTLEQVADIGNTVLGELAAEAKDIWDKCFAKRKNDWNRKALRPLRTLSGKMDLLSYTHGDILRIKAVLDEAVDRVEANPADSFSRGALMAVVQTLTLPDAADKLGSLLYDPQELADAAAEWMPLDNSPAPDPAPAPDFDPDPVPDFDPAPVPEFVGDDIILW